MKNILQLSITAVATIATGVTVAATPDIGDILNDSKVVLPENQQPKIPNIVTNFKPEITNNESTETFIFKGFRFTGNKSISSKKLNKLITVKPNTRISIKTLQEISTHITKHYRMNGYFVARAYIPEQDITAGIIEIAIVEGYYGNFEIKNSSYVNDTIINNIIMQAKREDIVAVSTIERSMLLVNDTHGAQLVEADIMPGKELGTSDFMFNVTKTKQTGALVLLDNHGSRYTGHNRAYIGVNLDSPTGYGDRLYASILKSNKDLTNFGLSYSAWVLPNGLKGKFSVSQTDYQLGDNFRSLQATGKANIFNFGVEYPYIRAKAHTLKFNLDGDIKHLQDEVVATATKTPKRLVGGKIAVDDKINTTWFNKPNIVATNVSFRFGYLQIRDESALAGDKSGARTNGFFKKLNFDISHKMYLFPDLTLTTKLRGQHAIGKNLDGSEEFGIGGVSGVKAYPSSEQNGDTGYVFGVELTKKLNPLFDVYPYLGVFFDKGRSWVEKSYSAMTNREENLADIGILANMYYGKAFVKLIYANRISSHIASTETPWKSYKILGQFGYTL